MVATTPNEIMDSPVDRTKTAVRIARRIRKLPGVRSVKTAGLYVPKYSDDLYPLAEPERLTRNISNNIATFEEQILEGMQHTAYFSITVDPEFALEVRQTVCEKANCVLAYTNVSGNGVEMFFIQTTEDPELVKFSTWDGRVFQEGASHGKDGAKRYRVRKSVNGRNNGSFLSRQTGETWTHVDEQGKEWECANWPLPNGQGDLVVVLVPEPHNANDNDGLILQNAAIKLAAACNARLNARTDFVQMLLLGNTGVYKCAAEILRGEPQAGQAKLLEAVPQADIFVGEAGANQKVTLAKSSLGRITLWQHKSWESMFVGADALQTYLRSRSYFEIDTMLGAGSAILAATVRQDQLDAITTPMQELQEEAEENADYKAMNPGFKSEEQVMAWRTSDEAEMNIGNIARKVGQSPFAWSGAIDFRHQRVPRMLQSMVKENATGYKYNDRSRGMPGWIIPGQYMMLMNADFAGVKEPRRGWIKLVRRQHGNGLYGYSIHPQDFDDPEWEQRSDTSDFDDKSSITPALDTETNLTYAVILRRPSSPFGGNIRRTAKADLKSWNQNTGIPVLPLRLDWKEQEARANSYLKLPMGISTGPSRIPQEATNDLEAELAANIWQATQASEVGKASLIIGAIALSELSDGNSKFITSELIDNSINQLYNGEFVTSELMDRLITLIHDGKPIFQPAISKIRRDVIKEYEAKYGHKPVFLHAKFPDHEKVWKHLVAQEELITRWGRTLAARSNGISTHMTEEMDPVIYRVAVSLASEVAMLWSNWGRKINEIRRDSEMTPRRKEDGYRPAHRAYQRPHRRTRKRGIGKCPFNPSLHRREPRQGLVADSVDGKPTLGQGQKTLQPHGPARRGRTHRILQSGNAREGRAHLGLTPDQTRTVRPESRRPLRRETSSQQTLGTHTQGRNASPSTPRGRGIRLGRARERVRRIRSPYLNGTPLIFTPPFRWLCSSTPRKRSSRTSDPSWKPRQRPSRVSTPSDKKLRLA